MAHREERHVKRNDKKGKRNRREGRKREQVKMAIERGREKAVIGKSGILNEIKVMWKESKEEGLRKRVSIRTKEKKKGSEKKKRRDKVGGENVKI